MNPNTEATISREELLALIRRHPAQGPNPPKDMVSGRYRILVNQPLPELSSKFAAAYAAHDEKEPGAALYALVYQNNAPVRQKNVEALRDFTHPHMVSLKAFSAVELSSLSEVRTVAVLERPAGQPLSRLLSEGRKPFPRAMLVNNVLRPFTEILKNFAQKGISHNRINLDNVYMAGDHIMLGECISEPSGFSQPFVFEPVERILTLPQAKADNAISADCYALAVLALHLALGFKPFADADREKYIESVLAMGSYAVLAAPWDFSSEMQDFFRGLLNDGRRERWYPESIEGWISGRKFNLIQPSSPNESARGFEFMDTMYYNRRAIAHALFKAWQDARAILSDNKLSRWLETSAHNPALAEMISRAASHANLENPRSVNEALARTLILLDPLGPIRFRHLSVAIDGVANLLAEAHLSGSQEDMQAVAQVLENDLPWFWLEQQSMVQADFSQMAAKLQRVRSFIRMQGLGFGIERCVYDLHTGLPCQSALVRRYHAATLRDLLSALNAAAPQRAAQDDFMDRHVAGFIASKIDRGREIKVGELEGIPALASYPGLIGLKLLMKAQHKTELMELHGLCAWVAARLLPVADFLHKRSARQDFRKRLVNVAASGYLSHIVDFLLKPDVFTVDYNGFREAAAAYAQRTRQIADLNNPSALMRHSRMAGRGIAQIVSYGVCLVTVYYTLKVYLQF